MKEKRLTDYTSLYELARRQIVLLNALTPRKLFNALGILYEYLTSRTVLNYRPVVLRIEPTSHCNLRCPTCHPSGNTFGGPMRREVLDRLLERIPFAVMLKGTLYLFGEPFFSRHLPEMIRAIGDRGVPTSTSTNFNVFSEAKAHEIIDAGLSWLIVCVDGADQETYARYRVGGSLERVLENIRIMVATKRARGTSWPVIEVQCIEFEYNRHQVDEIRRICLDLGVERFTVKRDVLSQMNIDVSRLTDGESGSRGDQTSRVSAGAKRRRARCVYLYGTLHVDYDGSVLPCCVGRAVFGNLLESSLDEIWNNEKFVAARRFFASGFRQRTPGVDVPCYTCPLFFPELDSEADRVERVRNQ